jgi:hypothetical protein
VHAKRLGDAAHLFGHKCNLEWKRLILSEFIALDSQDTLSSLAPPHPSPQVIHGRWRAEGKSFQDDLIRLGGNVEDTAEARSFFSQFKQQAQSRFQQLEIWVPAIARVEQHNRQSAPCW